MLVALAATAVLSAGAPWPAEAGPWPLAATWSNKSATGADYGATFAWTRVADQPLPAWPRRSAEDRERDRTLRNKVADGLIRAHRDMRRPPRGYVVDESHLPYCTSCWADRYRASLHRKPFAPRPGEAQLLLDDHAIERHRCVARAYEAPTKLPINASMDCGPIPCKKFHATRFSFYGSVFPPSAAYRKWRMWLGNKYGFYVESDDGLVWGKQGWVNRGGYDGFGMCVTHDAPHRRLLMGYHCGNNAESVCLAQANVSANGLGRWLPLKREADPTSGRAGYGFSTCDKIAECCGKTCANHADSYNCVRWSDRERAHMLHKRMAFGNTAKSSEWRAVRGVTLSRTRRLDDDPHSFEELTRWKLDREGWQERYERQIYTLTLSEVPTRLPHCVRRDESAPRASADRLAAAPSAAPAEDALLLGVMTVLHWPGLPLKRPPYTTDVLDIFAAPTRDDGRTYDLGPVYADTPLVGRPDCQRNTAELCPPDHGYMQPVSELVTTAQGEHLLYYEARAVQHENRWARVPTLIRASWPFHRLGGLRRDGECHRQSVPKGASECGELVTRPFALFARSLTLNVRAAGALDEVRVEVLDTRTGEPFRGFAAADAQPIARLDGRAVGVSWRGGDSLAVMRAREVQLRFSLCGNATLFAFTLHDGDVCG